MLHSFNTYNSIFNITSKNNKIIYYDGLSWKEIIFPYGAYEITQINDEIFRQLSNEKDLSDPNESPIILEANEATLTLVLFTLQMDYKIDFSQPNYIKRSFRI